MQTVLSTIWHGTGLHFPMQIATGDISHKPNIGLPLLSARPTVTFPASGCIWQHKSESDIPTFKVELDLQQMNNLAEF